MPRCFAPKAGLQDIVLIFPVNGTILRSESMDERKGSL